MVPHLRKMKLSVLNVSRNDMTDRGLQGFLKSKTLRMLDVSDQRIHYVSDKTLDELQKMTERNEQQHKWRKYRNVSYNDDDDEKPLIVEIVEDDEKFKDYVFHNDLPKLFPNTNFLVIDALALNEGEEPGLRNSKTRFPHINAFKHLKFLKLHAFEYFSPDLFTNAFANTLIVSFGFLNNYSLLDGLRRNSVITTLNFIHTSVTDIFFIELLKIQSIQDIYMNEDSTSKLTQAIIPFILKNKTLTHLQLIGFDFGDSKSAIDRHLGENIRQHQTLIRTLPFIVSKQLRGPYKNAMKDLWPSIYEFLGDPSRITAPPAKIENLAGTFMGEI